MSISLRVTGTWAELTADGSVTIPSTPQAGDRMYLFARWKDFSITASVANWTEITQFADGSTASGNGTGSVKVACWYRDWQSGDANPMIDFSASPTNASVVIMVMQKGVDDVWGTPLFRTAAMTNWTTTSQSVSASSTLAVPGGSVVMGLIGIRDDTATMTRPTNGIDDSGGTITWNGDYVESPATHHSTTTGDDGAADLGYRLVTTGATATLRMTGTISAAETGAALWVVQGITVVVTPGAGSLAITSSAPTVVSAVVPDATSLTLTSFAPEIALIVIPPSTSLTISSSAPLVVNAVIPASQSLTITSSAPTVVNAVIPASLSLSITGFAPSIRPFDLVYLDPGGDAVQADGYFGVAQGTGTVSFDTSQKRNGVGSWKFDSGAGNGNPHRKVASVLGPAGRFNGYFRYEEVPDTTGLLQDGFTGSQAPYSGGGFVDAVNLQFDDETYATATPAKNSAQGSTLSEFGHALPEDYVVDSIKIVYQRFYSTAASIGVSRVRWLVGEEEGPNHDNTDMPTSNTVVEVDITADRTWTVADINQIQVIAEALRGDTDTAHTQSWDYVKVQVEYRSSVPILMGTTIGAGIVPLRLDVLPTGSGVVLRLVDQGGDVALAFDGITVIPPNEFHRIAVCFVEHGLNDLEIKVYLDAVEELWLVERSAAFGIAWPELLYGWISNPGADKTCWFDQIYIDDVDDLSDPGPILMTAKLPATVNADNFDTTGGTGAVSDRPVDLTNYRQQAGSSQVLQNYTLQAANVGDIDISDETCIGYMGWAIVKKGAGTGTGAGLTVNGVTTDVTLPTSAGLLKAGVFDESYPSNAAGVGLRSIDGDADTFLYECGVIEVYQGPDTDDPLLPLQLLQEDASASVSDDMGGVPPAIYELRNEILEVSSTIVTTIISSTTAEGETPQQQAVIESNGGGEVGIVAISPGVEVSVNIDVAGADASVGLRRVDEIIA